MFFKDQVSELFIALPDEAKNQLAYKWPNNSIKKLSAMIVDADSSALFVSRGEVVGSFGPGRYKLDAKEWPFLGALVDWATDGNAYRAEVFFVSTRQFPNEKFGAKLDNVVDPRTGMVVSLRMHGEYAMQANNPEKLVLQLTGTGIQDNQSIGDWVDQQLIKSLRSYITTKIGTGEWPVLGLSAFLPEIETQGVSAVNVQLEEYGLLVPKFGNVDVSLTDEDAAMLKKFSKDTAYSQLAGSFGAYSRGEALLGAGEGMASGAGGANPALLAAGFGVGQNMMAGGAADTSVPVAPAAVVPTLPAQNPPSSTNTPVSSPAAAQQCPNCGAVVVGKFCGECGTRVAPAEPQHCSNCGAVVAGKFCGECGTPNGGSA